MTALAPCPGAGQPAATFWRSPGEWIGTCATCDMETNVSSDGIVWAGHQRTVEVHEQAEVVRWSLFPPGHRNRHDWSLHAVALDDGTWSPRCPGQGWLDVDHVWQYGTVVRDRLARLPLDDLRYPLDVRRLVARQLPDIIVNGRTAMEAFVEDAARSTP